MADFEQNLSVWMSVWPLVTLFTFCYSTKQDTAMRRYLVSSVKRAESTTAEKESGDCSQIEDGENDGHCSTEAEKVSRV